MIGRRAKWRQTGKGRLDDDLQIRFDIDHSTAVNAFQVQVRWVRCSARRRAKGLPEMVGEFLRVGNVGAVIGDRGERRHVIDLLVGVTQLMLLPLAPSNGDYWRTREPSILQTGRQINRANRLRHT